MPRARRRSQLMHPFMKAVENKFSELIMGWLSIRNINIHDMRKSKLDVHQSAGGYMFAKRLIGETMLGRTKY
jgi:hypothetical protein